jgi:hypothetical protein
MLRKELITVCLVAAVLLTWSVDASATINKRIALHFDGLDGATSTADASPQKHTVTFRGNAQLDTAYQAAGSASLLLNVNGSSDLTSADSPDWDILASNTDNWTVDFYVRQTNKGYQYYLSQQQGGPLRWGMYYDNGIGFYGGSSGVSLSPAGAISDNNWHWIAFCKVGDKYAMYEDGKQVNYTQTSSTGNYDGPLYIGSYAGTYGFGGNMDELRIIHDNVFGAAPTAGLMNTISYVSTPEPATIALLGLGALSLIRRKKH